MLCGILTVDEMQFVFMPERRTIDAVLILRRLQEEYHVECCICVYFTLVKPFTECQGKC